MGDSLDLPSATLAGLFASAILYGIFFVLIVGCLYVLLYRRKTKQPNYILISAALAMLLLNTAVIALSFSRVQDAFLVDPGGALDLGQWKEVTRTALTCVYMVLGDACLIYRCWIVWKKRLRVVAFPLLLLVACLAKQWPQPTTTSQLSIFAPSLQPWICALLGLTLFQNVVVTSLIVYRIWAINSGVAGTGARNLRPLIVLVVESGVIYATTIFIFLMAYVAGSNSEYIMVDCINPVIGITYSLLVVRVAINRPSGTPSARVEDIERRAVHAVPLQTLSVHVHRQYNTYPDRQSEPSVDSASDWQGGMGHDEEDRKEKLGVVLRA